MNQIFLIGRLTKNPEMTYVGADKKLAKTNYILAVDKRFSKDENATNFIRIVAFGKAGEFASKYFEKGKRVAIQGRLETSDYKNKNGDTIHSYSVIAENQEFADAPFKKTTKEEQNEAIMEGFTKIVEEDNELPFS